MATSLIKHPFRASVNVVDQKSTKHLVMRFSSLGDLVLCAPFVEQLRLKYPQDEIIFLTSQKFKDFLPSFKQPPNQVWGFEGNSLSFLQQAYQHIRQMFNARPFDSVKIYDLHGVSKSFFAKIGIRFFLLQKRISLEGFRTPKKTWRRYLSVKFRRDLLPPRHIYLEHQKLLTPAKFFKPELRGESPNIPPRNSILLAPDSQHWKKRWPVANWEILIQSLATDVSVGQITLVGGPQVWPQDLVDLAGELFGGRLQNRFGIHPFSDLAKLARGHAVCITGNSAWQHIAEAVDCPVISIPGPIVPGFGFSPWLPQSTELGVTLNCRPCSRHGDGLCLRTGKNFHACMTRVTPRAVVDLIRKYLQ